ncbi:MAG: acyltransferase family protein, partial [Acidimicrobiales bacterium]
ILSSSKAAPKPTPSFVTEPATPGCGAFAYQPALDGLRAFAVVAVLLFHGRVRWVQGGYVGVSVFFTLSGFLITSILIAERRRFGHVDAPAFYARRARRLLPAGAVCLVGIATVAAFGGFDGVPHLRKDLGAAALQVFNWAKLAGGTSYADVFAQAGGRVNPLDHFWSLGIEEQFYWFWPLSFAGLAALAHRRGSSLATVLAVPTVLFVAAAPAIAWVWGPDAAYWATPARVGEILTGAVAAAVVAEGRVPRWAARLAPLCLVAIAAACAWFPSERGPAYEGLLPLLSVVTALLLLGLQQRGPLVRVLSWRPFVLVGLVSYGLYLFHWPIYALLDGARLGFGGVGLLLVRLVATALVAVVSYLVVERPVRRARWRPSRTLVPALAVSLGVVALAVLLPSTDGPAIATGPADPAVAIQTGVTVPPLEPAGHVTVPTITSGPAPAVLASPTPSRPVRILVVGDSTAGATGNGLARWAVAHPSLAQVTVAEAQGCGIVLDGVRVTAEGELAIPPGCRHYMTAEVPDNVRNLDPDVVVLMSSWETSDRRWDGGPVLSPKQAPYRKRMRRDLDALVARIAQAGADRIVLVLQPAIDVFWGLYDSTAEEPGRPEVLHSEMNRIAAADPTRVRVADVAGWLTTVGLDTDHPTRPDGLHWSPPAAQRLATDFLGPLLVTEALT